MIQIEKKTAIQKMREEACMSRKAFAEFFGIPYSTLTDWELGKRKMPDYVLRLFAYRLKMEGYINDDYESGGSIE